jgi:hypothetical protein
MDHETSLEKLLAAVGIICCAAIIICEMCR